MFNPIITKERILKRSEEIGMPIGALLKSCGLSRNFISQLGSQKRNISASHLLALAERLDCSIDYLLGREEMLTGDQCVEIADAINAGVSMSTLVNLYGIDVARCWNDLVHTAECIRREESFV